MQTFILTFSCNRKEEKKIQIPFTAWIVFHSVAIFFSEKVRRFHQKEKKKRKNFLFFLNFHHFGLL